MFGSAKEKMAQKMMQQVTPSETPVAQALVTQLTAYEQSQAAAIQTLVDAADLEVEVEYNADQRADALLGLADAVAEQDVEGWWWDNVAPEVLSNPEQARQYVGLSSAEWFDQIRRWHQQYHKAGVVGTSVEDAERWQLGQTADRHIRETFGLSLREFVEVVVNWSRGQQIQPILGGTIETHNQIIRAVAEDIEDDT